MSLTHAELTAVLDKAEALEAENDLLRKLLGRAYSIASLGEHDPENPDITANETWGDWWHATEPVLRGGNHAD